jgi:hypothetical protein
VSTFDPLLTLKLSVQRALIGEVTDRLFGVTCGIDGKRVQIRAYFSGKVTLVDTLVTDAETLQLTLKSDSWGNARVHYQSRGVFATLTV